MIIKSYLESPQIIKRVQVKNLTLGEHLFIKSYYPNDDSFDVVPSSRKLTTITKDLVAYIYVKVLE